MLQCRSRVQRCGLTAVCAGVLLLLYTLAGGVVDSESGARDRVIVAPPLAPYVRAGGESVAALADRASFGAEGGAVAVAAPPPPPPLPLLPPPPPPSPSPSSTPSLTPLPPTGARFQPDFGALKSPLRCTTEAQSSWEPVLAKNTEYMNADDPLVPARMIFSPAPAGGGAFGVCGVGTLNVSVALAPSAYSDLRDCLALVRSIPPSRFCERTVFHSFWGNLPVRDQAAWFILSFLATQDLEFAELWVWSPPGVAVAADPLMAPFVGHPNVFFKEWVPEREAVGTQLAARTDVIAAAHDTAFWLETDLLRSLALLVYGGVYVDMDVLLLRNFGPLLGDEWLYQWGTGCVLSNGAVMRLHKGSVLAQRLLAVIIDTPAEPKTTKWGREAYLITSHTVPFLRLPVCVHNALWMSNLGEPRAVFNDKPHFSRWHGGFSMHLHGPVFSQGPDAPPGSEYARAKRELTALLHERDVAHAAALLEALGRVVSFRTK